MKKTKLLTSLSALLLVLSVGACDNNVTEDSSSEGTTSEETTTSESSSTGDTEVSTEGAYALYGDFVDSSWNESPDTSSKYFIPAGTEEYKVTVTIAGEPVDNEWWTDTNQWDAGFRVIEYGDYDALVVGSDNLDEDSTGVKGTDDEKNIKVNWNTTYYITITFGETPSILVQEELEPATDPAELIQNVNLTGSYTLTLSVDEYVSAVTAGYFEILLDTFDYDGMVASLTYDGSSYDMVVSYTEDALLVEETIYGLDIYQYLYVNCFAYDSSYNLVDAVAEFEYELGEGWSYEGVYQGNWQTYFYSLFDASDFGLDQASAYTLSQSGTDSEGNYVDLYTVGSTYTALYLVDVLGGFDFWYGDSSVEYASYVWMGGIYFYPELQTMGVYIDVGWFGTYDCSNYSLIVDCFSAEVSAVGETTIDEELIDTCWALTETD